MNLLGRNRGKLKVASQIVTALVIIWIFWLYVSSFKTSPLYNDDIWFNETQKMFDGNVLNYVSYRLTHWSARFVAEGLMFFMPHQILLWKWLMTLSFSAAAIAPAYWFKTRLPQSVLMLATTSLILLFPMGFYLSSGVLNATVNYIVPLGTFMLAWLPLVRGAQNLATPRAVSIGSFVLGIPLLNIGSNSEQLSVVSVFLSAFLFGIILFTRRHGWIIPIIAYSVISVGSMLFILLNPGQAFRMQSEIKSWYPGFADLQTGDKIQQGFSFLSYSVWQAGYLIPTLCVVILFVLSIARGKLWACLLLAYPVYRVIFGGAQGPLLNATGSNLQSVERQLLQSNQNLLAMSLFVCLILGVILLTKSIIPVFIGGTGIVLGTIIGFSPTVVASGGRSIIYPFFSLILLVIYSLSRGVVTEKVGVLMRESVGFLFGITDSKASPARHARQTLEAEPIAHENVHSENVWQADLVNESERAPIVSHAQQAFAEVVSAKSSERKYYSDSISESVYRFYSASHSFSDYVYESLMVSSRRSEFVSTSESLLERMAENNRSSESLSESESLRNSGALSLYASMSEATHSAQESEHQARESQQKMKAWSVVTSESENSAISDAVSLGVLSESRENERSKNSGFAVPFGAITLDAIKKNKKRK
ncbi:MAG: hypothetical protein LBI11_03340 [Streptococcaceae bacterium]|nr:hypothetical protein [Streptococcaceae bacterium]